MLRRYVLVVPHEDRAAFAQPSTDATGGSLEKRLLRYLLKSLGLSGCSS
jgi:hypothetical protein